MLKRKYEFLFATQHKDYISQKNLAHLYVIHKIEHYPRYTYPTVNEAVEANATSDTSVDAITTTPPTSPYRTVSHYGFNYPLNYMPSIALYPPNLLGGEVQQQRNLIIEFLKSTALILPSALDEQQIKTETTDNATNDSDSAYFTSVKELQLQQPKRKRASTKSSQTETDEAFYTSSQDYQPTHNILRTYMLHDDACELRLEPEAEQPAPKVQQLSLCLKRRASSGSSAASTMLLCDAESANAHENEAAASVEAHINGNERALEIRINVSIKRHEPEQLKHLTQLVDAEMQLISQQLSQMENSSPSSSSSCSSTSTTSLSTPEKRRFQHILALLESELEKLVNGILRAHVLAQDLRLNH